jgi:hypothetical protein
LATETKQILAKFSYFIILVHINKIIIRYESKYNIGFNNARDERRIKQQEDHGYRCDKILCINGLLVILFNSQSPVLAKQVHLVYFEII